MFGGGLMERTGRLMMAPWVEIAHMLGSGYRQTTPWDFQFQRDDYAAAAYLFCAPLGGTGCEVTSMPCKARKEVGTERCLYTDAERNEPIPQADHDVH